MALKYLQALSALSTLIRDPFDFPATMRFVDAVNDVWLVPHLHRRMLAGIPAGAVEHLRALTFRPIDLEALQRLPEGTLGRAYAAFIDGHRLSDTAQVDAFMPMATTLERSWFLKRFAWVHDIHHVLLGFDVDISAEMGLQIFNLRNFSEPFAALAAASLPLSLLRYGEAPRILREVARGWTLAGAVPNLFIVPFEEMFDTPLDDLRRTLGIPPPVTSPRPRSVPRPAQARPPGCVCARGSRRTGDQGGARPGAP
jgi:ubiquinone biosynthesis protein COQ4